MLVLMGMRAKDPFDLETHEENQVHEEKQVQEDSPRMRKRKKIAQPGMQPKNVN